MIAVSIENDFKKALDTLHRGGLVLAPTDTVWGLMCDYASRDAVAKLFALKACPPRPIALLADSLDACGGLKLAIDSKAGKLIEAFMPGPLTLILKSGASDIEAVCGENNSVGLRIPACPPLQKLIKAYGKPLAGSSANFAGREAPSEFGAIDRHIRQEVDYIYEFDCQSSGQASTVIDCTGPDIALIREGGIKFNTIKETID